MAPMKKMKYYKFNHTVAVDTWVVAEEYTADEDITIVGFWSGQIGRGGGDGAIGISKSGTTSPGLTRLDDVLYYHEMGMETALVHSSSNLNVIFPEDCRPQLKENDKMYIWIEEGVGNIQHVGMWYYET